MIIIIHQSDYQSKVNANSSEMSTLSKNKLHVNILKTNHQKKKTLQFAY